jgi:NADPH:quinone reductase
MKAVGFDRVGDAGEVLALRHMAAPAQGPGEVLIQVRARSIQPADFLFIAGSYRVTPRFPQVAGFDGSGVIAELGAGVTALRVGQRVAFRHPGAWAELAAVPVAAVYPVPEDLSATLPEDVVCQFALNPLTAWGLLDVVAAKAAGRMLATAGRSVVARLLGALATQRGLVLERLARDGAGYVVLRGDGDEVLAGGSTLVETLKTRPPFEAVLDPVGGPTSIDLINAMAPGGHLVSYGVIDDRPFEMRAATMIYRNVGWQGFGIGAWLSRSSDDTLRRAERDCWELLARQPSVVPVVGRYALAQFQAALQTLRANQTSGKVILT